MLNLGFVGEPVAVDPHILNVFRATDIIPVIAPIGAGDGGATYNINADTAAGAIAKAVGATRLLMLTDAKGVLDKQGRLIRKIDLAGAQGLIDDGTVTGGMIPKLECCMDAARHAVTASVILDGRAPHALLLEVFTERGAGTLVRNS